MLLNHGAQIDAQDNSGVTPLMNAAWFGFLLSVSELLKAGAKLNLKDAQGRAAIDLARLKKMDEIVEAITQYEG